MGVSSNKPKIEYIYAETHLKDDGKAFGKKTKTETDLKVILFLLLHQKELKGNNKVNEPINFYMIRENLKTLELNYNITEISDYVNSLMKNISLKEHIDWNKMTKEIMGYKSIEKNNSQNNNSNIPFDIINNKSNSINYPTNFSLIKCEFISVFNHLQNQNNSNNNLEKKIGYIINIPSKNEKDEVVFTTYIILNYYTKKDNDIYLGICLEEFNFKVDYLFIVNKGVKIEDFINIAKENIEQSKNEKIEKNHKIKINDGIDIIYYPENIGNNDYINNKEVYNKIVYYFSIDKMYNQFILSFNDIKNNELKEKEIDINNIEKLILNQKLILNENLVYLFDENNLKNNIFDDIFYYYQYNIYFLKNDEEKKNLIDNIFDKEDELKIDDNKNKINNFLKCLSYNDIYNNQKISLLSAEIYQRIQGFFNQTDFNYTNIETNLIKINEEFYIYFNNVKKFVKLRASDKNKNKPLHENNIWSLELMN